MIEKMEPLSIALKEFAESVRGLVKENEGYGIDLGHLSLEWEEDDATVLEWFAKGEWVKELDKEIKKGESLAKEMREAMLNMDMELISLLEYHGVDQPLDLEEWRDLLDPH